MSCRVAERAWLNCWFLAEELADAGGAGLVAINALTTLSVRSSNCKSSLRDSTQYAACRSVGVGGRRGVCPYAQQDPSSNATVKTICLIEPPIAVTLTADAGGKNTPTQQARDRSADLRADNVVSRLAAPASPGMLPPDRRPARPQLPESRGAARSIPRCGPPHRRHPVPAARRWRGTRPIRCACGP